ncbi:uncharacterized protein F4807DRAFT_464634 [Annulohypoxylon truncatum]|uniref:uncharacterized protein n=1 Tax=Annulohypoxylon truncatum TaxID=327061 RepID=UPI002007B29D|nr:uncharacterized protein F4807DRAFT_464634 [Annulohypoxylon truncatum]KAI1205548.1 hypothetical protein F4807DRAFT_464634 [Annulohypoxylon truncatum]
MSRAWDFHDFNDPDDDPVTRLRHLGGDYGPYDPAFGGLGDFVNSFDSEDDSEYDSDDSFLYTPSAIEEFFAEQDIIYPRNPKDVVKRTPAGPMLSLYDSRYFIPQWDEQMLGPSWKEERAKWDFNNPPKPLPLTDPMMQGAFKYCEQCQLTWLVGHDKLEGHHHPQHLSWNMGEDASDGVRYGLAMEASLVIFVHGASIPVGKPSKSPVGNFAGFGVFFGEGSKYNQAQPCGDVSSPRNVDTESAELTAVNMALTMLNISILGDREEMLTTFAEEKREAKAKAKKEALDTKGVPKALKSDGADDVGAEEIIDDDGDDDWEDESSEDEDDLDKLPFRVIIVSDKIQIVDNVCKHYKGWTEKNGTLYSKNGKPIKNGDQYKDMTFSRLEDDLDVLTKWYYVPKDQNKGAAKLAADALQGKFTGLWYENR